METESDHYLTNIKKYQQRIEQMKNREEIIIMENINLKEEKI